MPEIARSEPRPLRCEYRVLVGQALPPGWQRTVDEALHAARVEAHHDGGTAWELLLPWSTRVFGLVRRELEEEVALRVTALPETTRRELYCLPAATHAAHAAALAGVLVVAATAWLVGGWADGLPAGLTTAVAGGLWADAMRELAFERLERRLRWLVEALGLALWPSLPAEGLPTRSGSTLLGRR
jgi:hypothetical protein